MKNVRRLDDSVLFASALNENGIRGERFAVAGANVTIKAWPNDAKWERFATRLTRRGLPVLRKLIGVPPPNEDIAVVESSRAYQLGYAGFYNPAEGRVEVGDVLHEPTVLHELSHVWINRHLFTDRWVGEGLAEAMASRALDELGEKSAKPKPVRLGAAGSVKLNAWPLPAPLDPERAKVEAYAYNASYAVVEQLIDDIGEDGMREVIAAASNQLMPYQGDAGDDETRVVHDWRYFFDLVEIVGKSDKAEQVFRDHVLTPTEAAVLPDRSDARQALTELTEAGAGWSAPLEVREAMTAWEFDRAETLIEQSHDLLERSQGAVEELNAVNVNVGPSLEAKYEGANALSDYADDLATFEDRAEDVVTLRRRADNANPVAKLGMIGQDLNFDQITQAFADDELDKVGPLVAASSRTLDGATLRGVLIIAGVLLLALIAWAVVRRWRRRAAQPPASPAQDHNAAAPAPASEIILGEPEHSDAASE